MGQEPRKLVDANKRILISVKNAFKCKNYYIIVFFCQKAVEKSLEALIPHEKGPAGVLSFSDLTIIFPISIPPSSYFLCPFPKARYLTQYRPFSTFAPGDQDFLHSFTNTNE